jgi:hypothetical protein
MVRLHKTVLLWAVFFVLGCGQNAKTNKKISFYYWQTIFRNDPKMNELDAGRIYLRLFDLVVQDEQIYPNQIIQFQTKPERHIQIIPTIYIKNEVFFQAKSFDEIEELAAKTNRLIDTICIQNGIAYTEIQIDCDWTDRTKGAYFKFLSLLAAKDLNKKLSVTLRLHQIKYKERTGIPPADKFVLMYYNIGELENLKANSIYNYRTAETYVKSLRIYPRPFSLALPIFNWVIRLDHGRVKDIVRDFNVEDLENTLRFERLSDKLYRVSESHFASGVYWKSGDLLKLEIVAMSDLKSIVQQVSANKNHPIDEVIFYYWNEANLKKYPVSDLRELVKPL